MGGLPSPPTIPSPVSSRQVSDQVVKNVPQIAATPFDYQVPGSVEWQLQSIIATFDGTGAAADFLPGVEIIGPGGVTTGIFVDPNVKITAGSSGTVTFGPFLRSQTTTGGGGVTSSQVETYASQTLTVGAGGTGFYPFVHSSGQTVTSGGGSTSPSPLVNGVYLLMAYCKANPTFNANKGFVMETLINTGAAASASVTDGLYPQGTHNEAYVTGTVGCWLPASTGSFSVSVLNGDTGSHTFAVSASISRIG